MSDRPNPHLVAWLLRRRNGNPLLFGGAAAAAAAVAGTLAVFGKVEPWDAANGVWQVLVGVGLVFLLQRSQDRDTAAIQAKLDELVRVEEKADNALIAVEERVREGEGLRKAGHDP